MSTFAVAAEFSRALGGVDNPVALGSLLADAAKVTGCRYFALSHHIDFAASGGDGIRIHNYPDEWVDWFDTRSLGVSDPIHRASHQTAIAFRWAEVSTLITLTRGDEIVLEAAGRHGIGGGFTVPANVPGEARGSCSFAAEGAMGVTDEHLALAQIVGLFAFEAARRLSYSRTPNRHARLTDRQRECVLWVARGKTDWEIAQILGVSHSTIIEHVRHARERYGTTNRLVLTVRAIFDGTLCFSDVIGR